MKIQWGQHWDFRFLNLAKEVSTWSKDPSTKVGAVIVRPDKTIVSVGYNGFPRNMQDRPELLEAREEKYSRIVHAEINAFISSRESVTGYSLYTYPFLPCDRCMVIMAQAGIVEIIAPTPTEEQLTRWGAAFEKTKKYANEMGIDILEYNLEKQI